MYRVRFAAPAIITAVVLLAGCSSERGSLEQSRAPEPRYQQASADGAAGSSDQRRVAFSYAFSLASPGSQIAQIQQQHLAKCRELGCEVLSTNLNQAIKGSAHAHSTVRIAPKAFPEFERAISAPPSEVNARTETAEDKTLPLLDAEKRLEIKMALRDRLTAMLRDPGQMSATDLVALAREAAEVQGDIESAIAQRDYLRTITETVRVEISYFSLPPKAGGVNLSPVADALTNGLDTLLRSTAHVISFTITFIPWLPLVLLAIWAIRRLLRRSKAS
jgi:Domain of unknown function (DUF4349)